MTTATELMLKKLRIQAKGLKLKEKRAQNKLRAALAKVKSISRVYKINLDKKAKDTRVKVAAAEAAVYAKLAKSIQKKAAIVKKASAIKVTKKTVKKVKKMVASKKRR